MKSSFTIIICILSICSFGQLPGKKFKTPYKPLDNYEYKVGETIKIGIPAKGKQFEQIAIYKKTSLFEALASVAETASDVSAAVASKGRTIGSSSNDRIESQNPFTLVDRSFSNKKAVIEYFSFYEDKKKPQNNATFVVAKMVENPDVTIAFNMELALLNKEVYSNNPNYQSESSDKIKNIDSLTINQFSSKINTSFISATGDKDKQTVTINLLLNHKTVHQVVRLLISEQSAYDNDGNEYKASNVVIGSNSNTYDVRNKIPTNVPVKTSITFNKILPDIKSLKYISLKIYYDDEANGRYNLENEGTLEISNVKIKW